MLAKTVSRRFKGKVRFVTEDFGDSALAERFGIRRYPAVFVDEVLIAKPKDFGFYGKTGSQGAGRYAPWKDADNQARFAADLERTLQRALAGELTASDGVKAERDADRFELPELELTDLAGIEISRESLLGKVTVVEFWATWCPPCIVSLPWLNELATEFEDDLTVLGIAVESLESEVRSVAEASELVFPVVIGDPELATRFGDILAVPTFFVFDRDGNALGAVYGAPRDLHEQLEGIVRGALGQQSGR